MNLRGPATLTYRPPAVAPAGAVTAGHPSPTQLLQHAAIAARAYALWQEAGAPQGGEQQFWFAAKHELQREAESFAGKS